MDSGELPVRLRTKTSESDDHQSDPMPTAEEPAGSRAKFNLESLEPRILLSGDPVLAELARVVETDNQTDASQQPAVIVEEIDAALRSNIGLAADNETPDDNANESQSSALTVDWPDEWQASESESHFAEPAGGAEISGDGLLSAGSSQDDGSGPLGDANADSSANDFSGGPVLDSIDAALAGQANESPVAAYTNSGSGLADLSGISGNEATDLNLAAQSAETFGPSSGANSGSSGSDSESGESAPIRSTDSAADQDDGSQSDPTTQTTSTADIVSLAFAESVLPDQQSAAGGDQIEISAPTDQDAIPSDADQSDTNSDAAIVAYVASTQRMQESNRTQRSESNKSSGKSGNGGSGRANTSLPATQNSIPASADIDDETLPQGPPVFDGIHLLTEYSLSDTVQEPATVFPRSETKPPDSGADDTLIVPNPSLEEAQPRAPPAESGHDYLLYSGSAVGSDAQMH